MRAVEQLASRLAISIEPGNGTLVLPVCAQAVRTFALWQSLNVRPRPVDVDLGGRCVPLPKAADSLAMRKIGHVASVLDFSAERQAAIAAA